MRMRHGHMTSNVTVIAHAPTPFVPPYSVLKAQLLRNHHSSRMSSFRLPISEWRRAERRGIKRKFKAEPNIKKEPEDMPRGKKRARGFKGRRGLPQKQRFINQMGGWAQNARSTTGIEHVSMIGKPINGAVPFTAGAVSKSVPIKLVPDVDQWPIAGIKAGFQQVRPKKVTCFMVGLNCDDQTVNPNLYNIQVILAKFKDDEIGNTPIAVVPGAQVKMFNIMNNTASGGMSRQTPVQGETEIMRIACMLPKKELLNTSGEQLNS